MNQKQTKSSLSLALSFRPVDQAAHKLNLLMTFNPSNRYQRLNDFPEKGKEFMQLMQKPELVQKQPRLP